MGFVVLKRLRILDGRIFILVEYNKAEIEWQDNSSVSDNPKLSNPTRSGSLDQQERLV